MKTVMKIIHGWLKLGKLIIEKMVGFRLRSGIDTAVSLTGFGDEIEQISDFSEPHFLIQNSGEHEGNITPPRVDEKIKYDYLTYLAQ